MKQLDQHLIAPVQKPVTKEVSKEHKLIAQMRPHPGQRIFKYHPATKTFSVIGENDFEKQTVGLDQKVNKKLVMQQGCLYVVAATKKAAAKKFLKMLT